MENYSKLLKRQLKKLVDPSAIESLSPFLEKVNDSYEHFDANVKLLSRSMEMSTIELSDANTKLKESLEFLENFNYGATHDLKNHAINIRSMVVMLKKYNERENSEKVNQIITFLDKSSSQFIEATKSFLLASKIEMQKESEIKLVNTNIIKEEVLNECSSLIEEKDGQVIWNIDESITELPHQLSKITLSNLVFNGLKYSMADVNPIVEVVIKRNALEGVINMTIKDNGRGMDLEKNRKNLFKIFSRLSNVGNEEGTGMGLYLVKKMIERNSGSIEVKSKPGVGTTFEISLMAA